MQKTLELFLLKELLLIIFLFCFFFLKYGLFFDKQNLEYISPSHITHHVTHVLFGLCHTFVFHPFECLFSKRAVHYFSLSFAQNENFELIHF
jgi:hypothetical protein